MKPDDTIDEIIKEVSEALKENAQAKSDLIEVELRVKSSHYKVVGAMSRLQGRIIDSY